MVKSVKRKLELIQKHERTQTKVKEPKEVEVFLMNNHNWFK